MKQKKQQKANNIKKNVNISVTTFEQFELVMLY